MLLLLLSWLGHQLLLWLCLWLLLRRLWRRRILWWCGCRGLFLQWRGCRGLCLLLLLLLLGWLGHHLRLRLQLHR